MNSDTRADAFAAPLTEDERVPVIFRRWRGSPKTVIALFPTLPADYYGGTVTSYEHIGQHGAADYGLMISRTIPASLLESDVMDLFAELADTGYLMTVCQRRTPAIRDEFTKNLRSLK